MGQQWKMPGTEPTAYPQASQDRAPPSPAIQWQLLGCRGAGSESSSKAGRSTGGETPWRGGPKECARVCGYGYVCREAADFQS